MIPGHSRIYIHRVKYTKDPVDQNVSSKGSNYRFSIVFFQEQLSLQI